MALPTDALNQPIGYAPTPVVGCIALNCDKGGSLILVGPTRQRIMRSFFVGAMPVVLIGVAALMIFGTLIAERGSGLLGTAFFVLLPLGTFLGWAGVSLLETMRGMTFRELDGGFERTIRRLTRVEQVEIWRPAIGYISAAKYRRSESVVREWSTLLTTWDGEIMHLFSGTRMEAEFLAERLREMAKLDERPASVRAPGGTRVEVIDSGVRLHVRIPGTWQGRALVLLMTLCGIAAATAVVSGMLFSTGVPRRVEGWMLMTIFAGLGAFAACKAGLAVATFIGHTATIALDIEVLRVEERGLTPGAAEFDLDDVRGFEAASDAVWVKLADGSRETLLGGLNEAESKWVAASLAAVRDRRRDNDIVGDPSA